MSLNKKEMFDVYSHIRSKLSEEDMDKIKEKYPDFEDVTEADNKTTVEEGILILIGKLEEK